MFKKFADDGIQTTVLWC